MDKELQPGDRVTEAQLINPSISNTVSWSDRAMSPLIILSILWTLAMTQFTILPVTL